jgi:hypothetical protein
MKWLLVSGMQYQSIWLGKGKSLIQDEEQKKPATPMQSSKNENNAYNGNNWNNKKYKHYQNDLHNENAPRRSVRPDPVFAVSFRGEENHWSAIIRMHWKASIQTMHIGQSVVDISVIKVCQRTRLGFVHVYAWFHSPSLDLDAVGKKETTEALQFGRKSVKSLTNIKISKQMG